MNDCTIGSFGRHTGQWALFAAMIFALLFSNISAHAEESSILTNKKKQALVEIICEKLEKIYPFEDIAQATRKGITESLKSGSYDDIDSPSEFASQVTADMEKISNDKHLDLYYDPTLAGEIIVRNEEGTGVAGPKPSELEHARWENYGFKELRILHGNIGYLDLRMFFALKYAGPVAMAAMDFLAQTNAVIIDLRRNGGGWDDMVTFLASYFLDREEPEMVALTQSTLDNSYFASMVSSFVPGTKLTGIPVYILTSRMTASAAEAFASIVSHYSDKVILVGQTSSGAENPVEFLALDNEFVLKIPCYKKIFFGTREGWEAKGLEPDIQVESDKALETAHMHALELLQEQCSDEIAQEKLQWGIDEKRALLKPAVLSDSIQSTYIGSYHSAEISGENGSLYIQFRNGLRYRLIPIKEDYFLVEDRDDLRIKIMSQNGKVTGFERRYSDGFTAFHSKE